MNAVVGIDVGGANLKYVADDGRTVAQDFPLWRRSAELADQLTHDLQRLGPIAALAVTMTGELADCFPHRAAGVHAIIDQVELAAQRHAIRRVRYYAIDHGLVGANEARERVDQVAASNWHVLASFVASQVAPNGLLIDVGSTTTDLIPLAHGHVDTRALTDYDRLVEGSLVYVGCERTPVCSLVRAFRFRGNRVTVMNEWFATIDDARLVLGTVAPSLDSDTTADHRPRTRVCATARLARMIGLDGANLREGEAEVLAAQVIRAAQRRIANSLRRFAPAEPSFVISGHGHDLLPTSVVRQAIDLRVKLGAELSRCAPAHAVAQLLRREPLINGAGCGAS